MHPQSLARTFALCSVTVDLNTFLVKKQQSLCVTEHAHLKCDIAEDSKTLLLVGAHMISVLTSGLVIFGHYGRSNED